MCVSFPPGRIRTTLEVTEPDHESSVLSLNLLPASHAGLPGDDRWEWPITYDIWPTTSSSLLPSYKAIKYTSHQHKFDFTKFLCLLKGYKSVMSYV